MATDLGQGVSGVGGHPPPTAHLHVNPFFQPLGAQIGTPRHSGQDHIDGATAAINPQRIVTTEDKRAHIGAAQLVGLDDIRGDLHPFIDGNGAGHACDFAAKEQPFKMLMATEDRRPARCFIDAQPLKGAATVVQGMGKDMHGGFFPGDNFTVHPNIIGTHGHNGCSLIRLV